MPTENLTPIEHWLEPCSQPRDIQAEHDLSCWLAQYGVDLTDGPVVSAARGTGTRPEQGDAIRPGQVTTTRAALEREITGALRSCIDAHGPITREWIGSASKRIASALLNGAKDE